MNEEVCNSLAYFIQLLSFLLVICKSFVPQGHWQIFYPWFTCTLEYSQQFLLYKRFQFLCSVYVINTSFFTFYFFTFMALCSFLACFYLKTVTFSCSLLPFLQFLFSQHLIIFSILNLFQCKDLGTDPKNQLVVLIPFIE